MASPSCGTTAARSPTPRSRDARGLTLVCDELTGEVAVPGGLALPEHELAVAFHVPPLPDRRDPYLGHLLVVTRRHAPGSPI